MRRRAKLWMSVTGLVVVGLGAGGWYGSQMVKQKIGDEVVQTLNSPDTQKQIQKIIASKDIKSILQSSVIPSNAQQQNKAIFTSSELSINKTSESSTSKPVSGGSNSTITTGKNRTPQGTSSGDNKALTPTVTTTSNIGFQNRQAVITFAMSRFSTGEIAHFLSLWADRSSLSPAQKEQVRNEILSRFTPTELAAMLQAINK